MVHTQPRQCFHAWKKDGLAIAASWPENRGRTLEEIMSVIPEVSRPVRARVLESEKLEAWIESNLREIGIINLQKPRLVHGYVRELFTQCQRQNAWMNGMKEHQFAYRVRVIRDRLRAERGLGPSEPEPTPPPVPAKPELRQNLTEQESERLIRATTECLHVLAARKAWPTLVTVSEMVFAETIRPTESKPALAFRES